MNRTRALVKSAIILLLIAAVVAGAARWKLKQGSLTPPSAGESVAAVPSNGNNHQPTGFIVWSSNRSGNHDILKMTLPDKKIRSLTNHPHTEYYPRISPNGKQIVFSRSQKPWVSQRNQVPWDVILLDLETGEEQFIAKNANTPTWSADGENIYYQRNNVVFMEHNIKTDQRRIVFKSGNGDVRGGTILQTPHLSPDKKHISVTLRGKQNKTTVIDLQGKTIGSAGGCQITWNSDGSFLYYVDKGGKMKNVIYRFDPLSGESTKWLDLPGDYSHEYFPKLSNTEEHLVFSASSGGHEHDSADYEIFLWKIGETAESAERLTYHTGNDNWPDLYITK